MLILLTSSFPLPDPDAFVPNLLIPETLHPFLRGLRRGCPPCASLFPSLVPLCGLPPHSPGSHTAHTKRFPSEISASLLASTPKRKRCAYLYPSSLSPGFLLTPKHLQP